MSTSGMPFVEFTERGVQIHDRPPRPEDDIIAVHHPVRHPEECALALGEHVSDQVAEHCLPCSARYEAPISWPCDVWRIANRAKNVIVLLAMLEQARQREAADNPETSRYGDAP
ncbi:MAG: hypothetical protein L0I76_28435 [Pseudonocardia sp.]|nr:hypothetical protein [Pseudonocardia sp.]